MAALAQLADGPGAALRREVATLGEDQQRILVVEVAGQVGDRLLDCIRCAGGGCRVDELPGSRWKYTSTIGSACMVSFMMTRGSRR